MMQTRRSIAFLVALAMAGAQSAQAATVTVTIPNYVNGSGQAKAVTPVTCINPTTGNAESCAGAGGGGGGGDGTNVKATGTTTPANAALVGGTDGTNIRAVSVDTSGRQIVNVNSIAAGANVIGKTSIDQTTPGTTNAVANKTLATGGTRVDLASDNNGDLRAPRYTVTPFFVSVSANTNTIALSANSARAAFDIQCTGTAAVGVSRTGVTLTSATPSSGGADLVIPSGTTPYFIAQAASRTQGVTLYSASAQSCWGVSYIEQ